MYHFNVLVAMYSFNVFFPLQSKQQVFFFYNLGWEITTGGRRINPFLPWISWVILTLSCKKQKLWIQVSFSKHFFKGQQTFTRANGV